MKKLALVVASAALLFGLVSCASKTASEDDGLGAPEGLDLFMDEDTGPEWEATGNKVTSTTANTLEADTGVGVSLVVDKDISKNGKEVLGASLEEVKYLGETCVKITANYNPEIRFALVFDEPISAGDFSGINFSIAGIDGGIGSFNVGVMYDDMNGAEHLMSFYLGDVGVDFWSEYTYSLKEDEQWGNNYKADRKIIAIQLWSGDKGPIFMKDISLTK